MKLQPKISHFCRFLGIAFLSISPILHAQGKDSDASSEDAPAAEAKPELSPEEVRSDASYFFGYDTGRSLAESGLNASDLDLDKLTSGLLDAMKGDKPDFSKEQLNAIFQSLGDMVQEREQSIADENKLAGEEFLAENAEKEGVITTESGLQYKVLKEGGDEVYEAPEGSNAPQKIFQVKYKGALIDGTEFDASPEGETVPFTLQVVPGFREALTTMPVGAKWRLFLSPDLAYGESRAGALIEPNSTLIFDLELESIEDAPPSQGMPFQIPGQ